MNIPAELRYSKSHEWARLDGDVVTIGITDHAQDALGSIVYVELPGVGDEVEAEAECCVVESTKAASDVYAPIDGEVVEANEKLEDEPELVNSDSYGDGWFIKIRPSDPAAFEGLMDAETYKAFLQQS